MAVTQGLLAITLLGAAAAAPRRSGSGTQQYHVASTAAKTVAGGAPLERCPYAVGGPTRSSRDNTIQLVSIGALRFEQDCAQAESRGRGIIDLTTEGETPLRAGEMANVTASFASCTLAWPSRYGEAFLDWRGSGQFERLVDSVGGTRDQTMGRPFTFHFRVPADSVRGPTRLRLVTYSCQSCFRDESLRLNPCHSAEDVTVLDLAVRIEAPAATLPHGAAGGSGGGVVQRLRHIIPPLREQVVEREAWIEQRVTGVLPTLMSEVGVSFWVLVQREYGEDVVWRSVESPIRVNARRRTIIVFAQGAGGTVTRHDFVSAPSTTDPAGPWSSEQFWGPIRDLLTASEGSIAVNNDFTIPKAFSDGAHAGELAAFTEAMGDSVGARLTSAPALPIYFLALRLPAMLPRYRDAMVLAHGIIEEAMSSAVVSPGVTTCEDVSWWMWEAGRALGFPLSFKPSFGVQRLGEEGTLSGDTVIERGDFLWCDLGLIVMNLWTDTQHMGYVLREGESAPPAGLLAGLAQTNRLQDIVMAALRPGLTGNEVLAESVAAMEAEGIEGLVYSHPTGDHMHAAVRFLEDHLYSDHVTGQVACACLRWIVHAGAVGGAGGSGQPSCPRVW